jgi:hypothetical protein
MSEGAQIRISSMVDQSYLVMLSRPFAPPWFQMSWSPDARANSSDWNKLHSPWRRKDHKKRKSWTEKMIRGGETVADRNLDTKCEEQSPDGRNFYASSCVWPHSEMIVHDLVEEKRDAKSWSGILHQRIECKSIVRSELALYVTSKRDTHT